MFSFSEIILAPVTDGFLFIGFDSMDSISSFAIPIISESFNISNEPKLSIIAFSNSCTHHSSQ